MGAHFRFSCPDCGYSVAVSGGPDVGMMARTETMVCGRCSEVVDVLVGPAFPGAWGDDDDLRARVGTCPRCGGRDLRAWTNRRCPKCHGTMVQGELEVLWD